MAVYGLNKGEYYNLSLTEAQLLFNYYEISAGLQSGTEVFTEASKAWKKVFKSSFTSHSKSKADMDNEIFYNYIKKAKERTGLDKVDMQEVFKEMYPNSK